MYRNERTHQAVTDGVHKLMYRWDGSDLLGGPKYFYRLDTDPDEQVNSYDSQNADVLEWWDVLRVEVDDLDEQTPTSEPIDPGP